MSRRTNCCVFNNKEPEPWRQIRDPTSSSLALLPALANCILHKDNAFKRQNPYLNGGILGRFVDLGRVYRLLLVSEFEGITGSK